MIRFSQDEWEGNLKLTYPPFKLNGQAESDSKFVQFFFHINIILASSHWATSRCDVIMHTNFQHTTKLRHNLVYVFYQTDMTISFTALNQSKLLSNFR